MACEAADRNKENYSPRPEAQQDDHLLLPLRHREPNSWGFLKSHSPRPSILYNFSTQLIARRQLNIPMGPTFKCKKLESQEGLATLPGFYHNLQTLALWLRYGELWVFGEI